MAPVLLGTPHQVDVSSAAKKAATPNFSGEWLLERSENHAEFLRSIGYSALIAQTATRAHARQSIEQVGDELRCWSETVPPMAPARLTVLHIGDAEEVQTLDDEGRETVLVRPAWKGQVLAAGLRYPKATCELRLERYLEDGRMVEHLRYPRKGVEMRRIFKRSE